MTDENNNEAETLEMGRVEENAMELEEVGMEEAPNAPAPTNAPNDEKSMAFADVDIDQTRLPLFIVLVASLVLLIATGHNYEWDIVVSIDMTSDSFLPTRDLTQIELSMYAEYWRLQ